MLSLQYLVTTAERDTGHDFVMFVTCQITAIDFATIWNSNSHGAGGRVWMEEWYRAAFARDPAYAMRFATVDDEAVKRVIGAGLQDEYKDFKERSRDAVLARNRLATMYCKVSLSQTIANCGLTASGSSALAY